MNEPNVLLKTHRFLRHVEGLWGQRVTRLYTDAHNTLLPYKVLAPFQRFTLEVGDFVVHPDLVGQLSDGETVFAIEAKGEIDLLKGLAQAEMYQTGFHFAFLAADAAALREGLIAFARRKNVGILAVGEDVTVVHLPDAHMPLLTTFRAIARQMDGVIQIADSETFTYNIPTHYLAWAIALRPGIAYSVTALPDQVANYPMPKDWRHALSGAQKLGLVQIQGDVSRLTPVGEAVRDILPDSLAEWSQVHQKVGARGQGIPLADYLPAAAAALKLLLLRDPIVRLVIEGLMTFPGQASNFAELAIACDALDHAQAPIFFLKPEAAVRLMDERGIFQWHEATGGDYRSTTFYQYKSILKHAGILAPTKLGGATAKGYNPLQDIWALRSAQLALEK